MSPRLQMMVAFAAASLQARVSKYSDTTYPASPAAIQSAWTDAQIMMGHMPEEVRKELAVSQRAFTHNGNPYPDQG